MDIAEGALGLIVEVSSPTQYRNDVFARLLVPARVGVSAIIADRRALDYNGIIQLRMILMYKSKLNLAGLAVGQTGVVTAIQTEEYLHQRLRALGFRLGQPVQLIRRAAWHGPLQVRIGSTDIMIRPREAAAIRVQAA